MAAGEFCEVSTTKNLDNIIYRYQNPTEDFPKELITFAALGGVGLICFDYRDDPKSNKVPVVF